MKAKMLSFANSYFSESGLFNELRAIQIKNALPSGLCAKRLSSPSLPGRF
jgi:hypothetical protein